MNVLHWDGTLSAKDFRVGGFAFAQKWESLNSGFPPWVWVLSSKHPWLASPEEEGYLSLEKICISRPNEEDIDQISQIDTGEEEIGCPGNEDVIDDATLVQSSHHELHYCDFHIVYSSTFRVPVLYFRSYCCDGRPLPLDEIEKDLPACSSKELSKSKWTFITQEGPPLTDLRPFSRGMWITTTAFFFFHWLCGLANLTSINYEFQGYPFQHIGMIFWYSFSTLVFAHRGNHLSNLSKFVVIIWVFAVLINYNNFKLHCNSTSMLTVQQIELNSKGESVGYHSGSWVPGAFDNLNFENCRQRQYRSPEEYDDSLRGRKNGGVSAIIVVVPYLKVIIAKYAADYTMINTKRTKTISGGFGFVFPKGSILVQDMSSAIMKLGEEEKLQMMEKKGLTMLNQSSQTRTK